MKKNQTEIELSPMPEMVPTDLSSSGMAVARALPEHTQLHLGRMFRDPYILTKDERNQLIDDLQVCISAAPEVVELRVLLGMVESVDFRVQHALETLREAVRVDSENFLAQLKLGELLMRLRICDQAVEHTQIAARLATNPVQSELARRQAATLRTLMREGIERDVSINPVRMIKKMVRQLGGKKQSSEVAIIGQG
ncbi:MAG TPA: hypothetical protein VG714_05720 [Acidobacteriaceae bacterium]|nr:hypothetical protein [Acidobacteriaceae bacterium]